MMSYLHDNHVRHDGPHAAIALWLVMGSPSCREPITNHNAMAACGHHPFSPPPLSNPKPQPPGCVSGARHNMVTMAYITLSVQQEAGAPLPD